MKPHTLIKWICIISVCELLATCAMAQAYHLGSVAVGSTLGIPKLQIQVLDANGNPVPAGTTIGIYWISDNGDPHTLNTTLTTDGYIEFAIPSTLYGHSFDFEYQVNGGDMIPNPINPVFGVAGLPAFGMTLPLSDFMPAPWDPFLNIKGWMIDPLPGYQDPPWDLTGVTFDVQYGDGGSGIHTVDLLSGSGINGLDSITFTPGLIGQIDLNANTFLLGVNWTSTDGSSGYFDMGGDVLTDSGIELSGTIDGHFIEAVPEPSATILVITGLAGFGLCLRRPKGVGHYVREGSPISVSG